VTMVGSAVAGRCRSSWPAPRVCGRAQRDRTTPTARLRPYHRVLTAFAGLTATTLPAPRHGAVRCRRSPPLVPVAQTGVG
jgi:hypothetical protein